jgi:hypothetical protein
LLQKTFCNKQRIAFSAKHVADPITSGTGKFRFPDNKTANIGKLHPENVRKDIVLMVEIIVLDLIIVNPDFDV